MMGMNASSVVPNGNTIAGRKYIARRFVGDVQCAERTRRREAAGRLALQLKLAHATTAALRDIRRTEQFA
jgi:hypothetical protein